MNLGFMSFFTKACTEALRLFPAVNASSRARRSSPSTMPTSYRGEQSES